LASLPPARSRDDVGMDAQRPTRWQKARWDWPGYRWRDLTVGVIVILLTAALLLVLSRPLLVVEELLIVVGAGLAAAVLYPLLQLAWAWLWAPLRLLADDARALNACLDRAITAAAPPIDRQGRVKRRNPRR
jgi:hypothetical protein